MDQSNGLNLSLEEIHAAFQGSAWEELYPPILKIKQASALLQLPVQTLYQMSSQGQFKNCARKVGKHLLFFRDRLIQSIFQGN